MALSFDLSPAKYLMLGSLNGMPSTPPYVMQAPRCRPIRASAASVRYDGESTVLSQRVNRSSGGLCVRYNGASAVMLLRAHERLSAASGLRGSNTQPKPTP